MNFLNECYGLDVCRFQLHGLQQTLLRCLVWQILNKQSQIFLCTLHFFLTPPVDPDQVEDASVVSQQQDVENYSLKNHQYLGYDPKLTFRMSCLPCFSKASAI